MATDFAFRKKAMKELPTCTGVYVLCDLDQVPIYVGQSKDGIRARVSRHLTSARSDIIANRQIDVWEIAFVLAFPIVDPQEISLIENRLYHYCNKKSKLMNGTVPPVPPKASIPKPSIKQRNNGAKNSRAAFASTSKSLRSDCWPFSGGQKLNANCRGNGCALRKIKKIPQRLDRFSSFVLR